MPKASSTDGVPDTFNPEKNLEFTKVECLLYAFHTVAQMSSFLTDNPELFKELQVSTTLISNSVSRIELAWKYVVPFGIFWKQLLSDFYDF